MLRKESLKAVSLLIAMASIGSAQAPLWFETTPAAKGQATHSDAKAPATSQPTSTGSQQSTTAQNVVPWLGTIPWDSQQLAGPKTQESKRTTEAAKEAVVNKAAEKPTVDLPTAALPWSAVLQASPKATTPATKPTNLESAAAFIRRAETQLKLQSTQEQVAAPKLLAPEREVATKKSTELTPRETNSISTKLSSRALQSGEIESNFRWPNQIAASPAQSTLAPAAFTDASEESLIPPLQTALAVWQEQDPSGSGKKADSDEEVSSPKSEETDTDSVAAKTAKRPKQPEKFKTDSMIGPMTNSQKLFSMLEVEDQFQGYAELVNAARTRDLDSPMHTPYTFENYTWISPVFYHKPLYFEQPNLERYGQGTHRFLQPAASSIHFFGTIPLLPYKVLTQHPCEKYYTLGNRRPGNCNPVQRRVILGQSTVGEVREYWRDGSGY